jgi:hypothetical protein
MFDAELACQFDFEGFDLRAVDETLTVDDAGDRPEELVPERGVLGL